MAVLRKQWFLLALAGVLALGFLTPTPFVPLAESSRARNAIVATVLFLMALPLETTVVWQTIRRPWAALLGSVLNMGLLPPLAYLASFTLSGQLATGLIVAATAPCTLASAAVWTRRAGGNDAAAILVTVLTNSTCFLTTPLWLKTLTNTNTELDLGQMMTKLGLLVVLPMSAAQLMRIAKPVAEWSTRRRHFCSTLAQIGILSMVLIGAVTCSRYLHETATSQQMPTVLELGTMISTTLALHLVPLLIGYRIALAIGLARADCVAVAIAGSQKTLMVGLYVAINYFSGLAILPMISYHVGQLFLDTIIADRWARN